MVEIEKLFSGKFGFFIMENVLENWIEIGNFINSKHYFTLEKVKSNKYK